MDGDHTLRVSMTANGNSGCEMGQSVDVMLTRGLEIILSKNGWPALKRGKPKHV